MIKLTLVRAGILAACCAFAAHAAAQSKLPVTVDQRVRVWTAAAEAVTGRVVAATPETLQISAEGKEPVTVAVTAVRRIEVSRGGTSKGAGARKGALWGAIISGAIGAALLPLQRGEVGDDGASVGEAVALGAWSGGLFGGLIGAGVGAARAGEKWEQVWP
jgi:hypothetical protein